MRVLRTSELASRVGLSRSQIARLALHIPAHRLTRGGHHFFRDCPALHDWICERNQRRLEKKRKDRLARSFEDASSNAPMAGLTYLQKAVVWFTEHDLSRQPDRQAKEIFIRQAKPIVDLFLKLQAELDSEE